MSNKILKLTIVKGESEKKIYLMNGSFKIGRDDTCHVHISDDLVSRIHAEVNFDQNQWWYIDQNSTNGSYIDGEKITCTLINDQIKLELGRNGPVILLNFQEQPNAQVTQQQDKRSLTRYIEHYFFDGSDNRKIGAHTMMIKNAFEVMKKKESTKYLKVIGAFAAIVIVLVILTVYQQIKINRQWALAENIFYKMKTFELQIAGLVNSGSGSNISELQSIYNDLNTDYTTMINQLALYDDLSEEEKIIYHMAHTLGECELNIPPGFIKEVKKYIKKWQSTDLLSESIQRANNLGYTPIIIEKMKDKQLPFQFFFLALQESGFNAHAVGPITLYGYAKGIWQFMPHTALKYGLKVGPKVTEKKYDPQDERFDFTRATIAASRYIKNIYDTQAQASSLLVMASYNWGEHNVRNLIAKLPGNPRERNFWQLFEKYGDKIPRQTREYVFKIFSASVICENPQLFGFKFRNPLHNSSSTTNSTK